VVVAAEVATTFNTFLQEKAAPVLSSSDTLGRSEVQGVQLLLLVDTRITRLLLLGHLQHEPFCKN
jgi:hypothetical protein